MIASNVDEAQRRAIDAPFDASVAIVGPPGSGKTAALAARARRLRGERGANAVFEARRPDDLVEVARTILHAGGVDFRILDDVEAATLFEGSLRALFALEWDDFISGTIDPEIPGLRSPERFSLSAFRLFCKLQDAAIAPAEFLERAHQGGANFYAKPPNLAHPELIRATKDTHRDSLEASLEELKRQYRREIDLAKILARIYAGFIALLDECRAFTARDSIARAIEMLHQDAGAAAAARVHFPAACIDEAQDLTPAQTTLLETIYGAQLNGVTLAGDPAFATNTFRGARPERAFSAATVRVELTGQYRSPLAIELAAQRVLATPARIDASHATPALTLHRAKTEREEADFIAERVVREIRSGTPLDEIALVFRSVADVRAYEDALLEREVPVVVAGDRNIFTDPRALDALALLWNVWDPFRHEWLLRTLGGRAFALSESSLATLCAEPANAQTALFALEIETPATTRSSRWDPKRDLRLGWNVVRGEQDAALTETARARVQRFRALRAKWLLAMPDLRFAQLARLIWNDALALAGPHDSAKARAQMQLLDALLERLDRYATDHPGATLGDVLEYARLRGSSELDACEDVSGDGFVRLLSVDAAMGRAFDFVAIPDARAGAFPRWYVPDSFLFSPALGMIPKENVGEARAARTAKFTYYIHRTKARENYNAQERRAFVYAMRRAKRRVLVTASGRATRGITAPEFLEELRNARLPGTSVEE